MLSAFRSLNPKTISQRLERCITRTYSFRFRTYFNNFMTSASISTSTDIEPDDKTILKNESNSETTNQTSDQVSDREQEKWWRYKFVKLHRRKFSSDEKQRDASLNESMGDMPETKLFGQLKRNSSSRYAETKFTSRQFRKPKDQELSPSSKSFSSSGKPNEYSYKHPTNQTSRFRPGRSSLTDKSFSRKGITRSSGENDKEVDTFGTLKKDMEDSCVGNRQNIEDDLSDQEYSSDDDNDTSHRRLSDHGKHSPNWYGRQMRDFADQGKIKEAIEVLDVWMLKNERIRPNYYVFSVLISILGKAGYTKKAFSVFNQMKKMGVQPRDQTYTALFNACSNSPWSTDGLQRAQNLRSLMVGKHYRPNLITYRSMIKAFGICGDIQTAFAILEEASQRFPPDVKCFSFLLMACCSDKEAGFRHAVQVWRTIRQHGLKPDLPLYNLLLRVIRDCGIGDADLFAKLIHNTEEKFKEIDSGVRVDKNQPKNRAYVKTGHLNDQTEMLTSEGESLGNSNRPLLNESHEQFVLDTVLAIEDTGSASKRQEYSHLSNISDSTHQDVLSEMDVERQDEALPSISELPLDNRATSIVKVDVTMLGTAEGRLALVGSVKGILSNMESDGVQPDIKTLSQLVNSLPSNEQAELELLCVLADNNNIQPDVDFFNMLIRKRNLRQDYIGAKELVKLIGHHKLLANMTTFGCLAMGCRKKEDGLQLLQDIQASGLSPNQAIFTILVFNSRQDFGYKLELIKQMEELDIKPTDKLLMYMEKQLHGTKRSIADQERGKPVSSYYKSDYFLNGYKKFMSFYGPWLKRTGIEKGEHPWSKFRSSPDKEPANDGTDKDDSFVRVV